MVKPIGVLQLSRDHFPGSQAACEGAQIAKVILAVDRVAPLLRWYVADVMSIGEQITETRDPYPKPIGSAKNLIGATSRVEQFERGVFVGVPQQIVAPQFREGGLWTEDEQQADLGDSIVEIRAFDTSYIEILSTDVRILANIGKEFGIPTPS
jgi:hypothetical protein